MNYFEQMRALLEKLREAREAKGSFCMMDLVEWLEGRNGLTSDLDKMGYLLDEAQIEYELLQPKKKLEGANAA